MPSRQISHLDLSHDHLERLLGLRTAEAPRPVEALHPNDRRLLHGVHQVETDLLPHLSVAVKASWIACCRNWLHRRQSQSQLFLIQNIFPPSPHTKYRKWMAQLVLKQNYSAIFRLVFSSFLLRPHQTAEIGSFNLYIATMKCCVHCAQQLNQFHEGFKIKK